MEEGFTGDGRNQKSQLSISQAKAVETVEEKLQIFYSDLEMHSPAEAFIEARQKDCNLLQMAICLNRNDIFDFIMSISDYPLDYVNKLGETALDVAMAAQYPSECSPKMIEYYILELIKRNVSSKMILTEDKSLLHFAIERLYCQIVKYLIGNGVDLNGQYFEGYSALEFLVLRVLYAIDRDLDDAEVEEMMLTLLLSGAEPSIRVFEESIINLKSQTVRESLFLYLFDEYFDSEFQLPMSLLFELEFRNPKLCFEVVKYVTSVIPDNSRYWSTQTRMYSLFRMDFDCRKSVIEKFHETINDDCFTVRVEDGDTFGFSFEDDHICLETFTLLLESEIRDGMVNLIRNHQGALWLYLENEDELRLSELYYFFLSYGYRVPVEDLHYVFDSFGYCQLFKDFLHMDLATELDRDFEYPFRNLLTEMTYNINMDLEKFFSLSPSFKKYYFLNSYNVGIIFNYFVHPQLTKEYGHHCRGENLPKVPSLLELARNTFRKHIIQRYEIKTSRDFQLILSFLGLCSTYKKIINFETKLYHIQ